MIAAGLKTQMESLTPTIAESIERGVKGNKTDLKGLEKQISDIAGQFGQLKTEIPATIKTNLDTLLEELGEQVIEEEKGSGTKSQQSRRLQHQHRRRSASPYRCGNCGIAEARPSRT